MRPFIVFLLVLVADRGGADELLLKSGGRLSGRIVNRTATSIEIDIGAGLITVPTSSVVKVEEGRSALQEYEERAAALEAGNADGWVQLGQWASARGLGTQARQAFERALAASPGDPRANDALGRVNVDGRWVSQEEGYRMKGYVEFEGDWVTPAEHDAILRARSQEEAQARERKEAQARVEEAEARAAEAEARARQAEEESQNQGLPLWYGWGAGPVVWPTGPIVVPPIGNTRPRPVPR